MKKQYLCLALLLSGLTGCWGKKKVTKKEDKNVKTAQVDMPVASSEIENYFEEQASEFVLLDDDLNPVKAEEENSVASLDKVDDFTWLDEEQEASFKTVYFDFDKHSVKEDQKDAVKHDVEYAKKLLDENETAKVVVEGHACSSAGSQTYNLAKSAERAKALKKELVAEGIAEDKIIVVSRGQEVPALDKDGNSVIGDRAEQWPNRRTEMRVEYSA